MDTATANELANAPPGTITLGGVDFLVAQPAPQDMGAIGMECQKIARARRAARVLELFREFKDYEFAKQVATDEQPEATDDPRSIAATLQREMMEPAGCRFAAFLLLRKLQPDLTPARVAELIDEHNAAAVGIDLLMSSGLGKVVPNSVGANGSPSTNADSTQPCIASSEKLTSALPASSPPG